MAVYVTKLNIEFQKDVQGNYTSTALATWNFSGNFTSRKNEAHTYPGTLDKYTVHWWYLSYTSESKSKWIDGGSSDVNIKQATYSVPSEALKVRVYVKPVAKEETWYTTERGTYHKAIKKKKAYYDTKKVEHKAPYWVGGTTGPVVQTVPLLDDARYKPGKPDTPTFTLIGDQFMVTTKGLTAASGTETDTVEVDRVTFQFVKNSEWDKAYNKQVQVSDKAITLDKVVSYKSTGAQAGTAYRARAMYSNRIRRKGVSDSLGTVGGPTISNSSIKYIEGDWSDWSDKFIMPPAGITDLKVAFHDGDGFVADSSGTGGTYNIKVSWKPAKGATSYTVAMGASQSDLLNKGNGGYGIYSEQETSNIHDGRAFVIFSIEAPTEKTEERWFRVKSKSDGGESGWCKAVSIKLRIKAPKPTAPTTWSSVETAVLGRDDVILYWTHNCEDECEQTNADIKFSWKNKDGESLASIGLYNPKKATDNYFKMDKDFWSGLSDEADGSTVEWSVRTYGLAEDSSGNKTPGPYSTVRKIKYYEPISINTQIVDGDSDTEEETSTSTTYKGTNIFGTDKVSLIFPDSGIESANVGDKYVNEEQGSLYRCTVAGDAASAKWMYIGNIPSYSENITYYAIDSYPIKVKSTINIGTQKPIAYSISVKAVDSYATLNADGTQTYIHEGEEVFSKTIDSPSYRGNGILSYSIQANETTLQPGALYQVTATVITNVGLSSTDKNPCTFMVRDICAVENLNINAGIDFDYDDLTALISPYCIYGNNEETGNINLEDIILSVYRIENNGMLTEIETDIENKGVKFVTDPHPSLNTLRYRIVAKYTKNGAMTYADITKEIVGVASIVIQWNDSWTDIFDAENNHDTSAKWGGSMVYLPYNIDISEQNSMDVSLVEYIGRKRPVSYYGTQLGENPSWSCEIPKDDTDTINALRKLAVYPGDAYVREPSGVGYWAQVSVSFNINHKEMTVPVTIDIRPVEGGK